MILVLTACATLVVGNDSVAAIRQWAARTPQDVLHRLGARYHPWRGRYTVPGERTFRRILAALDGDALDTATCGYAADVTRGDAPALVIATCEDEPIEREQLLTLDALHTTKKTARLRAAQALLSGTGTEFIGSMDAGEDRGHGRTERRTLRVAPCDDTVFPGARQVFRLRRDIGGLDGVRTSKEIVHGILSAGAGQADPEHLNHYA